MGVVLCGDLYATLQDRGGLGDVKEVWRKFKKQFKWVVGIVGNHDTFGTRQEFEDFNIENGVYFLQQEIRKIRNLEFVGINGIIGRASF